MRFIHTADWHLGRSFFNVSLIDDQAYVLNQLIDIASETKPDVLIIAGDVYDRAVPSTDAVKLLDDVLCRLILDLKLPIILIAGNHDSPLRLEFAARLVESHRLFVFGSLSERLHAVDMYDAWGAVSFFPLPYAEPSQMGSYLHDDSITCHENAMQHWIDIVNKKHIPGSRTVPICHAFVVGGEESESERPLDIGGASTVSAKYFDGFHYAALGHLHRSQSLAANSHIHYSGSLLKYSFSEAEHTKCVKLVDLDAGGVCRIEPIALTPKRDVRCVEGTMDDLSRGAIELGNRDDYVQVRLLDKGAVFDALN
jgi:exonuclease SbcD